MIKQMKTYKKPTVTMFKIQIQGIMNNISNPQSTNQTGLGVTDNTNPYTGEGHAKDRNSGINALW